MPTLNTVEDITTYLVATNDSQLTNIWENLQESFEQVPERIQCFKTILRKRLRLWKRIGQTPKREK